MKTKILFVSHDATRTGAPIVFKHLIQWVKETGEFDFEILLKDGGVIASDFESLGQTHILRQASGKKSLLSKIVNKITSKIFRKAQDKLPKKLRKKHFDLIYINTVAANDLAPILKKQFSCPVILHVHENEYTIKNYFPNSLSPIYSSCVDLFIAVSESTQHNLVSNYDIQLEKVSLVYEFVHVTNFKKPTMSVFEIKQSLNLSDEFIIGGSGLTSWRKGIDLFVNVAADLLNRNPRPNYKFIWVGEENYNFRCELSYELERLGLRKTDILFTGSVQSPQDYFQIFDIFLLTSREDPFPLVCLEAASLSKPIICFKNSGGMPEFVANGGGVIVEYGNINAVAEAVIDLYLNKEKQMVLGLEAKTLVTQFDVSIQAPKIVNLIKKYINARGIRNNP